MGLFCHGSHDSAVAIADSGGQVVFASEQERYDRIKHSSAFPFETIESAFQELGIGWSDIHAVSFAWDPFADPHRILAFLLNNALSSARFLFTPKQRTQSRVKKWREIRGVKDKLQRLGWKGRVRHYNHHLCHAASAFFSSGFEAAACLTVDGNGEIVSTTIHDAEGGKFHPYFRKDYPNSLGHYYSALTQYLGFQPMNDEYKVMGLAAFGKKETEIFRKVEELLAVGEGDPYALKLDYFQFHKGFDQMWTSRVEELLGPARRPGGPIQEQHGHIALAVQWRLEEALLALSRKAKELGRGKLCLSGGVALNCVANERLLREGGWEDIFVPPCPHDSGTALGAAYLSLAEENLRIVPPRLRSASLGASLKTEKFSAEKSWKLSPLEGKEMLEAVCRLLGGGKIVAWADGRSEFGPRALGNRSLLADPRKAENKERLNVIIKKREPFRPFAPIVLNGEADRIFDMHGKDSPFMLRTVPVRPGWREKIPAAIHVDGSARVQTLERDCNPRLYDLLKTFEAHTGVPVLLNTSLNTAGEPIVNSVEEVGALFRRTEVEVLVLNGRIYEKA
jgi:carbamoyltransferase